MAEQDVWPLLAAIITENSNVDPEDPTSAALLYHLLCEAISLDAKDQMLLLTNFAAVVNSIVRLAAEMQEVDHKEFLQQYLLGINISLNERLNKGNS